MKFSIKDFFIFCTVIGPVFENSSAVIVLKTFNNYSITIAQNSNNIFNFISSQFVLFN